jgi:membrane associated rhomboid family serine protease
MFRSRTENFRAVYVFLFLNIAFFLLEVQDPERYALLFSFDRDAIAAGEVWRLVTWQFTQSGNGFMQALSLFFSLLMLYIMGNALEEEWGTRHLLLLFALSTAGSVAAAAVLGVPLLGAWFVYFTLLFIYAAAFPGQTFFLMGVLPVRVRLLAAVSLGILIFGVARGGVTNIAALAGAAVAYLYYRSQRVSFRPVRLEDRAAPLARGEEGEGENALRFQAIRGALESGNEQETARLLAQCDRERVPGVNICPPADFKPEAEDRYCVRCEGFAECSARYIRASGRNPLTPGDYSP